MNLPVVTVVCFALYFTHGFAQDPVTSSDSCTLNTDFLGLWFSSFWGMVEVTDTSLSLLLGDIGVQQAEISVLNCYKDLGTSANETIYIFKSTLFEIFTMDFSAFTCIQFKRENSDNLRISIKTGRDPSLEVPVKVLPSTEELDASFCDEEVAVFGEMIKIGSESNAALDCPALLQGRFNVTNADDNDNYCPGGASIESCQHPKQLEFSNINCGNTTTQEELVIEGYFCVSVGEDQVTLIQNSSSADWTMDSFMCLDLSPFPGDNTTIAVTKKGEACGGQWKEPEEAVTAELFNIHLAGPCEQPQVDVEPTAEEEPNATETGNSTSSGDGGDGNTTTTEDDGDDRTDEEHDCVIPWLCGAAAPLIPNNPFVLVWLTSLVLLLTNQDFTLR